MFISSVTSAASPPAFMRERSASARNAKVTMHPLGFLSGAVYAPLAEGFLAQFLSPLALPYWTHLQQIYE